MTRLTLIRPKSKKISQGSKNLAQPVVQLVNKRIAHRDLEAFKNEVTFNQMHACIDTLADLYVKYNRLITATTTSKHVAQAPWDVIFQYRWIEPDDEGDDA